MMQNSMKCSNSLLAGSAIRYMVIDIYDPVIQSAGAIGLELMIHYRIME